MTLGSDQPKFVAIACVNIVVAANAGGCIQSFWRHYYFNGPGKKALSNFSVSSNCLFLQLLILWCPQYVCNFSIPKGKPKIPDGKVVEIAQGGLVIAGLFLLTILTAVCFHSFLHLPPAIGMLTGLGYLKFFSYYRNTLYRKEAGGF